MKIIHTADWHLGDTFHGYDRIEEHEHFLNWLKEVISEEKPEALLIAGDVFDNANPSAQAEEMLYGFLASVTKQNPGIKVIITAGNHDSGRRLQAPAELLRGFGVEVRGMVEHDEKGRPQVDNLIIPIQSANEESEESIVILAVPYLRSGDYELGKPQSESIRNFFGQLTKKARKKYGKNVPVIAMGHMYAAGSEIAQNEHSERLVVGGEDCIDVNGMDEGISYVALGHIHKAQQVGGEESMVFYSGSPVPMSFAEKDYQHGVNKVFIGPAGGALIEQIPYTPLRKLQSIPPFSASNLTGVLKEIDNLPAKKKEDASQWRYIEIRLLEAEPNPMAQNEILNALQDKAARLCRLIRVVPEGNQKGIKRKMETLDQLRHISPLDIALDAFLQSTSEEMDDELISRFNIAAKAAMQQRES